MRGRATRKLVRPWARAVAAAAMAVALLASACSGGPEPSGSGARGPIAPAPSPSPNALCRHPKASPEPSLSPSPLPPAVSAVAGQVEGARGLKFERMVSAQPVTQVQLADLLQNGTETSYPAEMMGRRGRAWATMGAIPAGTDLHQAIFDYQGSQVIGFYDPSTGRLVFMGTATPSPYERVTLAHELTHALDDQTFDLNRLNILEARCQDEALAGFVGLVEGNAVETSVQWAREFLTPKELDQVQEQVSTFPPPPPSVPTFVRAWLPSPYLPGQAFVEALLLRGGEAAVNRAFRDPPVSTEQILHPDRYPSDVPVPVSVPEVASRLGPGWSDLDVMDVGEEWLRLFFEVRLPSADAEAAAAGWGGSQYRAWSNGDRVAVLLDTAWDTAADASEFDSSMIRFVQGQPATVSRPDDTHVRVLFGSDQPALAALGAAAASG